MSRKLLVLFTAVSTVAFIVFGIFAAIAIMAFLSGFVKFRRVK